MILNKLLSEASPLKLSPQLRPDQLRPHLLHAALQIACEVVGAGPGVGVGLKGELHACSHPFAVLAAAWLASALKDAHATTGAFDGDDEHAIGAVDQFARANHLCPSG